MKHRNPRSMQSRPPTISDVLPVGNPEREAPALLGTTVSQVEMKWARALLEGTWEGILIVDGTGIIRFANRNVEALFGWGRDELIGQPVEILLSPDSRHRHQQHRVAYMQTPVKRAMGAGREFRVFRKDGTDLHVEIGLSPITTDDGPFILCLITDISARVASEARPGINERRLGRLFRAFPRPTYVWQRQAEDFRLIDFNDPDSNGRSITLGYPCGSELSAIFPAGSEVAADIRRCYQEKRHFTHELQQPRTPGSDALQDMIFTYAFVEPDVVLVVADDVTAEQAAYAELKKLSNAVEQTADAVFITDRVGRIEYVNPGFERITGFKRAQALGQNPRLLKSGEMPQEYYQRLWETLLAGQPFRGETINRKRDRTRFVAEQTITPIKDREGRITHFVSVLKDMTERLRLHEQETEHRLAGEIQQHLFPLQPPQIAGYDIAGAVFPARTTSGDYFDYMAMPGNKLGIVVADVCGHGMGPALVMAETRAYLRSITRYEVDPRAVLRELNLQLQPDLLHDDFVTMVLAQLDPERHLLDCANAGHPPAYVLDAEGRTWCEQRRNGIPIGVFPDLVLDSAEPIPLARGGILVLMTDGITEAEDAQHREFGIRRALAVVRRHRAAPAAEIVNRVREAVCRFVGSANQFDDQCMVICKRVD